jgi:hypothetical protein
MGLGSALTNSEIVGGWNYIYQNEVVKWSGCSKVVHLNHMNPFTSGINVQESWTWALANKKVLVILPFENSLRLQFEKIKSRKLLSEIWCPTTTFSCMSPPITFAGMNPEKDWHEELINFCARLNNHDFEVALIAAGAYGALIADYIKRSGKKAIHLGGSLQLLFGIMGCRWEHDKNIRPYVNSEWTRPEEKEVPKLHAKVDKSSYW